MKETEIENYELLKIKQDSLLHEKEDDYQKIKLEKDRILTDL